MIRTTNVVRWVRLTSFNYDLVYDRLSSTTCDLSSAPCQVALLRCFLGPEPFLWMLMVIVVFFIALLNQWSAPATPLLRISFTRSLASLYSMNFRKFRLRLRSSYLLGGSSFSSEVSVDSWLCCSGTHIHSRVRNRSLQQVWCLAGSADSRA